MFNIFKRKQCTYLVKQQFNSRENKRENRILQQNNHLIKVENQRKIRNEKRGLFIKMCNA